MVSLTMVPPRGAARASAGEHAPVPGAHTRVGGGISLDLEVTPGASDPAFPAGYNPWRKRIGIRVRAPPENGRANLEVVQTIASFFDVPSSAVTVEHGHLDRRKTVSVAGIAGHAGLARLRAAMQGEPDP